MLNCRQFMGELCDYLDGAPHSVDVVRHLSACRKCRIVCETTRQTILLYRIWPACPLPAEVEQRLMAALESRIGRRPD
jgi:hypothetical protein